MSQANITFGAVGKNFGRHAALATTAAVAGVCGSATLLATITSALASSGGSGADALYLLGEIVPIATVGAGSAYAAMRIDKSIEDNKPYESPFSARLRHAWGISDEQSPEKKLLRRSGFLGGAVGLVAPLALAYAAANHATDGNIQGALHETLTGRTYLAEANFQPK